MGAETEAWDIGLRQMRNPLVRAVPSPTSREILQTL